MPRTLPLITLAALVAIGGCQSSKPTPVPGNPPPACTLDCGCSPVLRIDLAGARCSGTDGYLRIESPTRAKTFIWLDAQATTIDDGIAHIPHTIESEFKNFTATSTDAFAAGNIHGKRIHGTGAEADDDDPGFADVIVFSSSGHIFVACVHGEDLHKSDQEWMVKVVQSAKTP